MNCLCGKPACWRIWEANLAFCQKHGRMWLASEEKKIVGTVITEHYTKIGGEAPPVSALDLPEAREPFLHFVARVERDASLWLRVKRRFGGGR